MSTLTDKPGFISLFCVRALLPYMCEYGGAVLPGPSVWRMKRQETSDGQEGSAGQY